MVFAAVDPSIREKIIAAHLAGHGRNQIDRELREQGIKVSHGSISNFIRKHKREHEQPSHIEQRSISAGVNINKTGSPSSKAHPEVIEGHGLAIVTAAPRNGGPLSHFSIYNPETTAPEEDSPLSDSDENALIDWDCENTLEKRFIRYAHRSRRQRGSVTEAKSAIEIRLDEEHNHQWQNYGPAWHSLMQNMRREKDQRRHEMLLLDRRKRLEQMRSDLTTRESRILESEPYLSLAKKLAGMKLTLEDTLPWLETITEVGQMYNMDSKQAAISVAEDMRLNKQLGGIQRQIEKANQELALINMATIQKQQALTLLMDLSNRGVTESQIVQLIAFASEWNKMMTSNDRNDHQL